jgi:hypothetical protein
MKKQLLNLFVKHHSLLSMILGGGIFLPRIIQE